MCKMFRLFILIPRICIVYVFVCLVPAAVNMFLGDCGNHQASHTIMHFMCFLLLFAEILCHVFLLVPDQHSFLSGDSEGIRHTDDLI